MAVSDIALKKQLPEEVSSDLLAYVGCVAGAILIDDYHRGLRDAGFDPVEIIDTGGDLNVYGEHEIEAAGCSTTAPTLASQAALTVMNTSCCGPDTQSARTLGELLKRYNINDYAASVKVYAIKPQA